MLPLLPEWMFRPIWMPRMHLSSPRAQGALLWSLAIAAGRQLPLAPVLDAFADDERGWWRYEVHQLAAALREGVPLPDALDQHPGLLPPEVLVAARVGWESGTLGPALQTAATRLTARRESLDESTNGVIAYLVTLSLTASAVIGFVMYYIIPKLKKIFEDFGTDLPALTRFVIRASDAAVNFSFLFVPLMLLLAWWLRRSFLASTGLGRPPGLRSLLGWFTPRLHAPEVLRYLAIVVAAGRPVTGTIDSLCRAHPQRLMRQTLARVRDQLERGVDCWRALQEARLISPAEAGVLEAAERAGNLAWALEDAAERIERRIVYRLELWSEFGRPVVLVVFGTAVGVFAVGLFMPLVKLLNDLS
jgi:type IV pilus assembly protein PilC